MISIKYGKQANIDIRVDERQTLGGCLRILQEHHKIPAGELANNYLCSPGLRRVSIYNTFQAEGIQSGEEIVIGPAKKKPKKAQ
jgi:hypothetical protein